MWSPPWQIGMPHVLRRDFNPIMSGQISHMSSMTFKKVS
jgi:hypothetical protein